MSDRLTVKFDYSPAEHVDALEELPHRRLVKKWWVPGSIVFLAVPFTAVALSRGVFAEPLSKLLWLSAFSVLPLLAIMLSMPIVMRRIDIARYRRARADAASAIESRFISHEGISSAEGSKPIPWSMITRVIESDNFFLFFDASSDIPEYLPKRSLAATDVAVLQALLRQHFHLRLADLQLLPRAT